MKKSLFNPLLLLAGLLVSNLSVAQVTPISGVVEPEISTAESPKWYTMMSSHLTASDRQNRFMKWDGSNLCTDQLTTPPTDAAHLAFGKKRTEATITAYWFIQAVCALLFQ